MSETRQRARADEASAPFRWEGRPRGTSETCLAKRPGPGADAVPRDPAFSVSCFRSFDDGEKG